MDSTYAKVIAKSTHQPVTAAMALKVRKSKAPPPPKGCPMSACMELLGGAWTTNVV